MGDFADLRRFARWSGRKLDVGFILLNPVGAPLPVLPQEASPYYPGSRLFLNPLYLRVEEVPGAVEAHAPLKQLAAAGRALNAERLIHRDAVFRLKMRAMEKICATFPGHRAFDRYRAEQGETLRRFARRSTSPKYCVRSRASDLFLPLTVPPFEALGMVVEVSGQIDVPLFLAEIILSKKGQCLGVLFIRVHQQDSGIPFDDQFGEPVQQTRGQAGAFERRSTPSHSSHPYRQTLRGFSMMLPKAKPTTRSSANATRQVSSSVPKSCITSSSSQLRYRVGRYFGGEKFLAQCEHSRQIIQPHLADFHRRQLGLAPAANSLRFGAHNQSVV